MCLLESYGFFNSRYVRYMRHEITYYVQILYIYIFIDHIFYTSHARIDMTSYLIQDVCVLCAVKGH